MANFITQDNRSNDELGGISKLVSGPADAVYRDYSKLDADGLRKFHHLVQNPPIQSDELPGDPWQVRTLDDALAKREPIQYVAAGLFALPSLNIVYGSPGTLKSFLLADLAVCVAAGQEWLAPTPWINGSQVTGIKTMQCPVMWLDFDNGSRRTDDRFGALARAYKRSGKDTPLYYYSMPSPWLDASDKGAIGALAMRIRDRGVKLVIVDNLGVVSGDADENSGEMVSVMSAFRQLAEESGAAIILIHHQRKGNGTTGRAGDALRGHSSIEAALDLALMVEREDLSSMITIRGTKVRGPDVLPFSATFTYEEDLSGELLSARFFGVVAEDNSSDHAIDREIKVALYGAVLNKGDLTQAVKKVLPEIGANRIRNRIDVMASQSKIRMTDGQRNHEKLYALV